MKNCGCRQESLSGYNGSWPSGDSWRPSWMLKGSWRLIDTSPCQLVSVTQQQSPSSKVRRWWIGVHNIYLQLAQRVLNDVEYADQQVIESGSFIASPLESLLCRRLVKFTFHVWAWTFITEDVLLSFRHSQFLCGRSSQLEKVPDGMSQPSR
jgi:hypothetical protein